MAQLRHGVGTCLWPQRQSMQISVAATTLFTMTYHATVPAVAISTPETPLLSSLPPCSRRSVGKDFYLLKIRTLLPPFASSQLPNFFLPLTQGFPNLESRCESQTIKIDLCYFYTCKYVPLFTHPSTKYDTCTRIFKITCFEFAPN